MHKQRGEPERLQKVLARAGLASRREAEDWIRTGRLTVNGQTASLGVRVGPDDEVRLDGRVVHQRAPQSGGRAYIYHRSPGESLDGAASAPEAHESPTDAQPLFARLPTRGGRRFIVISPMPRIDGGLELVCGDGELAARLQRSVRQLSSELSVRVRGELLEQQLEGVRSGLLDSGEKLQVLGCEPAGGEGTNRWYSITARGASGKDVRQLFERQGAIVSRVLRTRLGTLALERSLGRGHFRELARDEVEALLMASIESKPESGPGPLPGPRAPKSNRAVRPKRRQATSGQSQDSRHSPRSQPPHSSPSRPPRSRQAQSSRGRRPRGAPRPPVRRDRTRD